MLFKSNVRGSALIYILIAIALVAALTASLMKPSTQQTRTQNSFKVAAEIGGQVQMIRSAIQDCILQYPEGDGAINVVGYHANYPLEPDSVYLPTTPAFRAADKQVGNLRCPGKNPGGSNQSQHEPIFGGSTGRFMPSVPALFAPWTYRNGSNLTVDGQTVTGVYFQTTTTASDAYLAEAMQKVDSQLSDCESDYIVGDGSNGCASNTKCLRIWIKRVLPACP